jgi:hypothetical protein
VQLTLVTIRVARFLLIRDSQTGKMYQINTEYFPNVLKIFQMAIKDINIFQSKALQKFTQIGIFGLKTNHLATLVTMLILMWHCFGLCLHTYVQLLDMQMEFSRDFSTRLTAPDRGSML